MDRYQLFFHITGNRAEITQVLKLLASGQVAYFFDLTKAEQAFNSWKLNANNVVKWFCKSRSETHGIYGVVGLQDIKTGEILEASSIGLIET